MRIHLAVINVASSSAGASAIDLPSTSALTTSQPKSGALVNPKTKAYIRAESSSSIKLDQEPLSTLVV
jgi:hypothetical protein